MLLSVQVGCELIKVNKIEKESYPTDYKKMGAQIFYGKAAVDSERELQFSEPNLVCLELNQSVKVLPSSSSKKNYKVNLKISFDSGNYSSENKFSDDRKITRKDGQLCFLFGHYTPSEKFTEKNVYLYINFLTKDLTFTRNDLIFLHVSKKETFADFNLFKDGIISKEFFNRKRFHHIKCITHIHPDVSFKLNNRKFTLVAEGEMHLAFFDENNLKTSKKLLDTGLTYLKIAKNEYIIKLYYGPSDSQLIV